MGADPNPDPKPDPDPNLNPNLNPNPPEARVIMLGSSKAGSRDTPSRVSVGGAVPASAAMVG